MSTSSTFMAEIAKKLSVLHDTGYSAVPKYTAMHQQQYVIQPANSQENLIIQPPKKIWKMESDGSLAPPAY